MNYMKNIVHLSYRILNSRVRVNDVCNSHVIGSYPLIFYIQIHIYQYVYLNQHFYHHILAIISFIKYKVLRRLFSILIKGFWLKSLSLWNHYLSS